MQEGYVYILSNPSMPGLLKIGKSIHSGRTRAKEIYQTGVPTPFKMEFEIFCGNCHESEILVHEELDQYRINQGREFFKCDIDVAVKSVVHVCISDYMLEAQTSDMYTDEVSIAYYTHQYNKTHDNHIYHVEMASAISIHLSDSSIDQAVTSYREWCETRKKEREQKCVK